MAGPVFSLFLIMFGLAVTLFLFGYYSSFSVLKINHFTRPATTCGGVLFVFGLRQQAMIFLLGVLRPNTDHAVKPLLPHDLVGHLQAFMI